MLSRMSDPFELVAGGEIAALRQIPSRTRRWRGSVMRAGVVDRVVSNRPFRFMARVVWWTSRLDQWVCPEYRLLHNIVII